MKHKNKHHGPIGIFDSGIGGLSVLKELWRLFPGEDFIYIADQIHVPYGTRTKEEVLNYSKGIVRYLLGRNAKLIVVACNTASAASLADLRSHYKDVPFVGMEPAVKPAAEETSTGVVGVLATPATFQGDLYASTVERFARGVKVLQHTCPGLVAQIEAEEVGQGLGVVVVVDVEHGALARKPLTVPSVECLVPIAELDVNDATHGPEMHGLSELLPAIHRVLRK